jgi:hypothetical protein
MMILPVDLERRPHGNCGGHRSGKASVRVEYKEVIFDMAKELRKRESSGLRGSSAEKEKKKT